MDLPGETYLFNLSLIAFTFAAVSTLLMLLRHSMGGRMSNFDIHQITAYVAGGFTIAFDAILPPLASLGGGSAPGTMWGIASGLSALFLALYVGGVFWRRRRVSHSAIPPIMVSIDFVCLVSVVLLLAANAVIPSVQGVTLFAMAITSALAVLMWSFVRRIASLLGDKPSEDWDPKRG